MIPCSGQSTSRKCIHLLQEASPFAPVAYQMCWLDIVLRMGPTTSKWDNMVKRQLCFSLCSRLYVLFANIAMHSITLKNMLIAHSAGMPLPFTHSTSGPCFLYFKRVSSHPFFCQDAPPFAVVRMGFYILATISAVILTFLGSSTPLVGFMLLTSQIRLSTLLRIPAIFAPLSISVSLAGIDWKFSKSLFSVTSATSIEHRGLDRRLEIFLRVGFYTLLAITLQSIFVTMEKLRGSRVPLLTFRAFGATFERDIIWGYNRIHSYLASLIGWCSLGLWRATNTLQAVFCFLHYSITPPPKQLYPHPLIKEAYS